MAAIRLVFNPSGPSCNHVHIVRASNNEILEVYEEADFKQAIRAADSRIMLQIKFGLLNSGLNLQTATRNQIRNSIESRDYILT